MSFSIRAALLVLAISAPAAAHAQSQSDYAPLSVGSAAPDFSETDIFGRQTIDLRAFRGKMVLLTFWASSCELCKEEIPAFTALEAAHGDGLVVLGASVFSSAAATELFYVEYHLNFPMFYGSYDLMGRYGKVAFIPTTFLIDREGKVAAGIVGTRTQREYEELLKPFL